MDELLFVVQYGTPHDTPNVTRGGTGPLITGGTPNMPAYYQAREGYKIIREVGVDAIREKARRQTQILFDGAKARGLTVNSPEAFEQRGNHVTIDFPGAEQVKAELIRRGFVVDYRPGAGIRVAPHFYTDDGECAAILEEIDSIRRGS